MIGRLLLWDIDGTLVRAGSVGAVVFYQAIGDVTGRAPDPGFQLSMGGKTDPQIVRDHLLAMQIEPRPDTIAAVLRRMEVRLADAADEIPAGGYTCPGVAEILARMAAEPRVISSVLTGNVAPNAVVKLAAFDLDRYLDLAVGAYGSDDEDRLVLVPIAMTRAADQRGARLQPDDVWVIGDTPRDLACAQAAGVHCLLVGTGRVPVAELAPLGADAVLDDLADTEAVAKLLLAGLDEGDG